MATPLYLPSVGILEQSMGAKNRVGIGLLYLPARLHTVGRWNRFLGIDSWLVKYLKYQLSTSSFLLCHTVYKISVEIHF